ncbi:MAG: hypothetical protein KA319_13065 [Ferruginibacter sp.]|nr:hypothetical protein [Ferruginibacter sp.]
MSTSATYYPRALMARCIFAWLLIILVYFFCTHSLVHQLQQPALQYPGSDNTFWVVMASGIYQFFVQQKWAAVLFDVVLIASCMLVIIFPQKKYLPILPIAGVWLLYIFFCGTAGKQYAQIGFLITPVAFLAFATNKFNMLWNAVRYWVCFLYVVAGVSKMLYGGFGFAENMSNILMQDNAQSFVFVQKGFWFKISSYFIENPSIAQWLYRLAALFEAACIVGFFTKKYDKWLLIGLVSFHVGNLFLLNISFVEQSLIFAPFLPWHKWAKAN